MPEATKVQCHLFIVLSQGEEEGEGRGGGEETAENEVNEDSIDS